MNTDTRLVDLKSGKISSGRISANRHLIYFVFDSRLGFWGLADRIALFLVGPNPRWRMATVFKNSTWSLLQPVGGRLKEAIAVVCY